MDPYARGSGGDRRVASIIASAALALGCAVLASAAPAWASTVIQGSAATACAGTASGPSTPPQPCAPLAGVLVTLVQNSTALETSLTSSKGEFVLDAPGPGTYTVLGSGDCGEQPEAQVTVAGQMPAPVSLVYPVGDAPFATCSTAPHPVSSTPPSSSGGPASGKGGANSTGAPSSVKGKEKGKHAHRHKPRKRKHRRRRRKHHGHRSAKGHAR